MVNLEGNGTSWSVQIHIAKTGREKKKSNWVVSMLTIVKIPKIREKYNSKWFFGLSSKGKTPAVSGPLERPPEVQPLQFLQVQN